MRPQLTCVLFAASIGLAWGADTEGAKGLNAIRLTKYVLGVADLDKSYAFYHALGIQLSGNRPIGQPAPLPDMLLKLVDVPSGTRFRNAMLKIPGADFALEMTEFTSIDVHPGRPRIQDPGASVLAFEVEDVDEALAIVKKIGAEVVTSGGEPLKTSAGRAVLVKDPDGYFVELMQLDHPGVSAVPEGLLVRGAHFTSIVEDAEKAAQFYKDRFGFEANVVAWSDQEALLKFSGVSGAQFRGAKLSIPGTKVEWNFLEFKGLDRKPYRLRIPDPGAPAVGLEVHDLDTAAAAYKSTGGSVITQGGKLLLNGSPIAFMRDPNGILVEVVRAK